MANLIEPKWISDTPCIVTGKSPSEWHHIYTRKSRPHLADKSWNKIPVCREVHSQFHAKGTLFMSKKFPVIKYWLIENGWKYDEYVGKWMHDMKEWQ